MMSELEHRTMSKVSRRILPLVVLGFVFASLDRVNVGFAALTMNEDLGITATQFGLAAGIFFIGYMLFEIPSNFILQKVGPKIWLARIMITWGLIAMATALVRGPDSLYAMRFVLGLAEAGFAPGAIFLLTQWFPAQRRGQIMSIFLTAVPASIVIGAPLSGLILKLDGLLGFQGWQWLFVLQGFPPVALGVLFLLLLTNRPAEARWLADDERRWLTEQLSAQTVPHSTTAFLRALRDRRAILVGLAYIGILNCTYGITLWTPQIVESFGRSTAATTLLTAVPYVAAIVGMIWWARRSDRRRRRVRHVVIACLVGAVGFATSGLLDQPGLSMVLLTVTAVGAFAALSTFWTLPQMFLVGSAAAAGIALINMTGNFGGFFGPFIIGYLRDATGSFAAAMLALALSVSLAGLVLALTLRRHPDSPQSSHQATERSVPGDS